MRLSLVPAGKTTAIVEIILQEVKRGNKVLSCCLCCLLHQVNLQATPLTPPLPLLLAEPTGQSLSCHAPLFRHSLAAESVFLYVATDSCLVFLSHLAFPIRYTLHSLAQELLYHLSGTRSAAVPPPFPPPTPTRQVNDPID